MTEPVDIGPDKLRRLLVIDRHQREASSFLAGLAHAEPDAKPQDLAVAFSLGLADWVRCRCPAELQADVRSAIAQVLAA